MQMKLTNLVPMKDSAVKARTATVIPTKATVRATVCANCVITRSRGVIARYVAQGVDVLIC
jgi:hypothetical protein